MVLWGWLKQWEVILLSVNVLGHLIGNNQDKKTQTEDRNLIRYLMRHRHTSPFEMCEVRFHLKIPIFVMRQHVRHRSACLSGDTVLDFDIGGKNNNFSGFQRHPLTIKDVYDRWKFGCFGNRRKDYDLSFIKPNEYYSVSEIGEWLKNRKHIIDCYGLNVLMKAKNRKMVDHYKGSDILSFYEEQKNSGHNHHKNNLKQMFLRSINEETKEIYHTRIKDIWVSGKKQVYELLIGESNKNQRKIKTSKDHLFFTEYGWKKLEDIYVGDNVWLCSSQTKKHDTRTRLKGRLATVQSKRLVGVEETYDIEVEGPFHNFSANSFIVHNSLNEYSGRYSEMSDEFYIPESHGMKNQNSNNKQMSGDSLSTELASILQDDMRQVNQFAYKAYQNALKSGLSRELSRIQLPVSNFTELYWKIDLHNFFHYIKLRKDPKHAQGEIVSLASIMYDKVKNQFPLACEAFEDYIFNSMTFSAQECLALKSLLNKDAFVKTYLTKREQQEFNDKIERILNL